ncbi:MAG: hypothetical protein ACYCS7_13875 [Acidimicrobiales bacterium]
MPVRDEHRPAWSAAGGVVMLVFIGLATAAWQSGRSTSPVAAHVPEPAFGLFVTGAVAGLYFMVAPSRTGGRIDADRDHPLYPAQ